MASPFATHLTLPFRIMCTASRPWNVRQAVARPVVLSAEQRDTLESRARARSAAARSVERARIVLLAAAGMQDKQIAAKLRIMPEKAARWRNRFLDGGLAALNKDVPRPGRTPTITPTKFQEVIWKTTQEKPSNATHWSTRSMAKAAGLSEKSVRRIWHQHGLQPHLARTVPAGAARWIGRTPPGEPPGRLSGTRAPSSIAAAC